jgi:hypothetical protein
MPTLSIIILSYNTREITFTCLDTLNESLQKHPSLHAEIIVVDNASTDDSPQMLKDFNNKIKSKNITYKTIINKKNEGFTKGNNTGLKSANGKYILFLNSDVIVKKVNWEEILEYMDRNPYVGVLTVRVELPNGSIDPASHRGFPSLWNSFSYYSKLEWITKHIPVVNRVFGGYHRVYQSLNTAHEIDSPSGAFFLTSRQLLSELGGFDESFFMYGEDIDMAYRIKQKGYKVMYYPHALVIHLKYQSGLKQDNSKTQDKTRVYFYDAMKIFYKKHYAGKYPKFINKAVNSFIDLKSRL